MNENNFMRVEDVAKELGISISHSYKVMQQLNKELKAKGYMTIAGRVNRKYFMEKFCYNGKKVIKWQFIKKKKQALGE